MRIAAQLFTLRDFTTTQADFVTTLSRLKSIGYDEVQLSAVACMNGTHPEVTSKQCRTILDELEISAPLTHRGWDEIKDRTDQCIEFHQAIGAELVAIGSIPAEYKSEGLDGYRKFVDDAEPVIARLKDAGLLFAYHNHAFEFERFGPTQEQPFQLMIERGSRDFLFEIDTYWVVHAGVDLLDLIKQLHGRIPMVHLKDKAVKGNETQMAPVGEGSLNWPAVLRDLNESGTYLGAVEQDDCYGRDPFDCLHSSRAYLSR